MAKLVEYLGRSAVIVMELLSNLSGPQNSFRGKNKRQTPLPAQRSPGTVFLFMDGQP